MQVFEPSCMPLGINYSRPNKSFALPHIFTRFLSPSTIYLDSRSSGNVSDQTESIQRVVTATWLEQNVSVQNLRKPRRITVSYSTYFGDNKGTSSAQGQRCLVRQKGNFRYICFCVAVLCRIIREIRRGIFSEQGGLIGRSGESKRRIFFAR